MALALNRHMVRSRGELRHHPLQTRLRARRGDELVLDSAAGQIIWEPKRVVPVYGVPADDMIAALEPNTPPDDGPALAAPLDGGPPVLTPAVPFHSHSTPGTSYDVRTSSGEVLENAAFRPDDPDLADLVFLDFLELRWWEEDEEVVGHPRDPFHRIDVWPSSRHIEVSLEGRTLASSNRAHILTETSLPPRYYFPRDDVSADLLEPSDHQTTCAYKGHADHLTATYADDGDSIAWVYEEPLNDALGVGGMVAFYTERVDVTVDGVPQRRPNTPWSKARHE
jgi:uncharacterized protein (DUF427 family)